MLWELHVNCQNVKIFGQANGTLKIFKLLPWLPGPRVVMETQTGGEIRTFFGYGRKNKKLASIKNGFHELKRP